MTHVTNPVVLARQTDIATDLACDRLAPVGRLPELARELLAPGVEPFTPAIAEAEIHHADLGERGVETLVLCPTLGQELRSPLLQSLPACIHLRVELSEETVADPVQPVREGRIQIGRGADLQERRRRAGFPECRVPSQP
nr:hypothetical protein [Thiocapsa sp. KS1]